MVVEVVVLGNESQVECPLNYFGCCCDPPERSPGCKMGFGGGAPPHNVCLWGFAIYC